MKARLARVFDNVKTDYLLIANTDEEDSNFFYLTGFKEGIFEGDILLAKRNSMTLFLTTLEYGMAKKQKPKEMKLVLLDKPGMLKKILKKELRGQSVGINGSFLPYRLYKALKSITKANLVDVSDQLRKARLIKDAEEIKLIRQAVIITKKVHKLARDSLKIGISESEVANIIDTAMIKLGTSPAFKSLVAFDSHSAVPHHTAGTTRLRPNSIVLIDIGARYNHYCADMTRTFMFKPDPKSERYKKFNEMYSVVKKAQLIALNSMKEGALMNAPHEAADNYIKTYKGGIYEKVLYSCHWCHSIGLDVHDGFGIAPKSKTKLAKNIIFSNEPGIYIDGFGGVRIEDDVLVGKSSSKFM